jgi:hypothetical protein
MSSVTIVGSAMPRILPVMTPSITRTMNDHSGKLDTSRMLPEGASSCTTKPRA